MALEARLRVDVGEDHAGTHLCTRALSDLEDLQGTEHGLVTRALCCEALRAAGSRQADEMQTRAAKHVEELLNAIRDEDHRRLFLKRPPVRSLLSPASPPDASPR
jgi:hypothetical protein